MLKMLCVLEGSHTLAKSVATSTTGLGMFQNLKRKSTCLGCKALLDNDGMCVVLCMGGPRVWCVVYGWATCVVCVAYGM